MNLFCFRRFLAHIILLILTGFFAAQAGAADLRVTLSGFPSSRGIARISLYAEAKGFPDNSRCAYRTGTAAIANDLAEIVFSDIPEGTYAISAYHDENENHKLDKRFWGLPAESIGASGYTALLKGKPVYAKSAILVDKQVCDVSILLFLIRR